MKGNKGVQSRLCTAMLGLLALLAVVLAPWHVVFAYTEVSGYIYHDTTWDFARSPYIVTGDVTVRYGHTLTIGAT